MDHFTFQAQGRVATEPKRFGKKLSVRLINDYYDFKTKEDVAQTVDVDFIGKDADHAEKYYTIGTFIQVRGRVANNQYEKDGEKIYNTQLTVKEHTVLAFKQQHNEN